MTRQDDLTATDVAAIGEGKPDVIIPMEESLKLFEIQQQWPDNKEF